jgi:hypothetical protein
MSESTLHIPKFRSVERLTDWVRRRYVRNRLPAEHEQVFFKVAEKNPKSVAKHVALYAAWVGPLGEGLESLLRADSEKIMAYGECISRAPWQLKLPEHLHSGLAGDFKLLIRLARHLGRRLSPELELSMLACDDKEAASRLVSYADMVGPLDEDLERRIVHDHDKILKYFQILVRNKRELPRWMMDELKGDSVNLYHLSRNFIWGRLPEDLENTMDNPGVLYDYAKSTLHSRLPEHLEMMFLKDHRFAIRYAFDVVRGFANVKLPDELHSMLVMKSFENPNDNEIKRYVNETEKFEK